jgi:hypothetical protein
MMSPFVVYRDEVITLMSIQKST